MAAPNYAAYDSAQTLSLSAAAHLWVEMTPVAKRGNIAHPSPTDDGWEYEFWLWLKERINQLKSPGYYPKGFHKFPRSLYLEIAKSDEYAALLNTFPKLKALPLFLFPEERPKRSAPIDRGKKSTMDDGRLLPYGGLRPNFGRLPALTNETGGIVKDSTKRKYYEWLACARWSINRGLRDKGAIGAEIARAIQENGGRPTRPDTIIRQLNRHFTDWDDPDFFPWKHWKDPLP